MAPRVEKGPSSDSHSTVSAYKHVPRVPFTAVLDIRDGDTDETDASTDTKISRPLSSSSSSSLSNGSSRLVRARIASEYLGCGGEASSFQDYRLERFSRASTVARVANALARVSHENLVDVFGMGDDFVVTTPWDETLRSYLLRRRQQEKKPEPTRRFARWLVVRPRGREPPPGNHPGPASPAPPLDLWRDVALPVARALGYLHARHMALRGGLGLDGIVLRESEEPSWQDDDDDTTPSHGRPDPPSRATRPRRKRTTKVYLRDFSRAVALDDFAAQTPEAAREAEAILKQEQALDVYHLGLVWNELALRQPLPPGEASRAMDAAIGGCCDPRAAARPSARRAHKRLLEVLRHLPPAAKQRDPKHRRPHPTHTIPWLHGLGAGTTAATTTSSRPSSDTKTSRSQCPTEASSSSASPGWASSTDPIPRRILPPRCPTPRIGGTAPPPTGTDPPPGGRCLAEC